MPTNKNALIRYMHLDTLLSDRHHYYDMRDLTDICNSRLRLGGLAEVTQRCIEKDIRNLESEPFNAHITRERRNGKTCIQYTDTSFSIFTKKMSDEERMLLREVLSTLGQFDGLDNFTWLDDFKNQFGVKESRKIISFSTNHYLKNSSLLGKLFDTIANRQTIELGYHTFKDAETSRKVVVYPYQLKQYNERWFLLCSPDDDTDKILNFALDRIDSITPLPAAKYIDCKIDLQEHFDDIVGVTLYADRPLQKITLWASEEEAPYIETKPIHPSQKWLKGEVGERLAKKYCFLGKGKFFEIECIENYELKRVLTSFGDGLLVLSPKNIQDDIHRQISDMATSYNELQKHSAESEH